MTSLVIRHLSGALGAEIKPFNAAAAHCVYETLWAVTRADPRVLFA